MTTNITDIYILLDEIGYKLFTHDQINLEDKIWQKKINLCGISIQLFLEFKNWNYLTLPSIYIPMKDFNKLSDKIQHIKFPLPHFSLEGKKEWNNEDFMYGFCYALHDRIELPRHQFYTMIKYIEDQCLKVLNILINNKSFRKEVSKEFYNIWRSIASYSASSYQYALKTEDNFSNLFIATKVPDDITQTYNANFFLLSKNNESYKHRVFKTKVIFIKITDGRKIPLLYNFFSDLFFVSLSKVLSFLKEWSIQGYNLFLDVLKKNIGHNILDNDFLSLCFTYRDHTYAISFAWKNKYFNNIVNNNLMHKSLNISVLCSVVDSLDMNSVINRNIKNIQSKTLKNKRIMQVGVGAIGGYLADGIVKIGAGISEDIDCDHKLLLVDRDTLSPDNLGRHILGYRFLSFPKTVAMKECIEEQYGKHFPNIISINSSIDLLTDNEINKQNTLNLVIDATGSLEVAEYINEQVLRIPLAQRPHVLHLWIYGNGECVQGLWVDPEVRENLGGCINCLHLSGYKKNDPDLSPLKDIDFQKIVVEGPCAAYTPYAVSAGMNAASLGIDMILEWLDTGIVKMNYQTRYNSAYNGGKISNMKLRRQARCPHCYEKSVSSKYEN